MSTRFDTYENYAVYEGQCLIQYTVLEKNYSIWSPSGYSDTDPRVVDATKCPVNHFVVHYNPEKPGDAFSTRP